MKVIDEKRSFFFDVHNLYLYSANKFMGNNYNLLIEKINEFTRKFYLNKLLRGSIYAAALILSLYLCLFIFTYYAYPSIVAKTVLFFSFLILALVAIAIWIIKPALSYFKLNKNLSVEQAADLIGNHFANVKDRLLNTLQLHELSNASSGTNALIMAGIDQKISELKPIPFSNAINLSENKRHIKFIIIPLTIILTIGLIAPAILRDGTTNFLKYNQEVIPQAPFQFKLINKSLAITQGDDLTIKLKLNGDEFPQDIYLEDGVNSYKLEKQNISEFKYSFKNVQNNKIIRFTGGGFKSKVYTITVNPRPSLLNVSATLVYPAYLHRKSERLPNAGDLTVPEGTKVNWVLKTENSAKVIFTIQNTTRQLPVINKEASFSAVIRTNTVYQISPRNNSAAVADGIKHLLTIIPDQYPSISVLEMPDSLSSKAIYFSGSVADDYGFTSLTFNYEIKKKNTVISRGRKSVPIKHNQTENSFFYFWNLKDIKINDDQYISYFFEVADNDGVNGAKKARSETKIYKAASPQEIASLIADGNKVLKEKMEATVKLAQSIEKESKKLSENLLNKKELAFEDKKLIEQLLEKQKQLDEAIKDIKAQNEKNKIGKQDDRPLNDELKEKQKQIDQLFNNVLDDKTKELLQKLQKLMEQNSKDQTREELSKMQMDNKSVKNELDRILALYKQLEFEQNLQNKIDRLEELSKQQNDLAQENQKSKNELVDKQEQLNKKFDEIKKELQNLEQQNQALDRPNAYKNPKEETDKIEKDQQESKNQLSKNNKEKAAEKQKQAAQQMQQLADKMQEQQQSGTEDENKVNAQELRKLLENLLVSSFSQEKLMIDLRKTASTEASYVLKAQQQHVIRDNMKTIADSLYSLSKRVPQLESTVNTEIDKINFNVAKAIEFLSDRRTAEANRSQQFAMTGINNLTLLLNEALSQLQDAMKNAKDGKGGKGKQKQGMQQLQQMQEKLNKSMQQAKEKMEQQGGNMGTAPKGQMSKELAEMAQQQQMIREALEKINREDNKDGRGGLGNLNQAVQDMKQSELDLVNKRITQETINRQKNLVIKLLNAEKAQREQDQDSKRESDAATQFPPSYQKALEKHNKTLKAESEIMQKLSPNLNYYYKEKVAEYFKLLNLQRK